MTTNNEKSILDSKSDFLCFAICLVGLLALTMLAGCDSQPGPFSFSAPATVATSTRPCPAAATRIFGLPQPPPTAERGPTYCRPRCAHPTPPRQAITTYIPACVIPIRTAQP